MKISSIENSFEIQEKNDFSHTDTQILLKRDSDLLNINSNDLQINNFNNLLCIKNEEILSLKNILDEKDKHYELISYEFELQVAEINRLNIVLRISNEEYNKRLQEVQELHDSIATLKQNETENNKLLNNLNKTIADNYEDHMLKMNNFNMELLTKNKEIDQLNIDVNSFKIIIEQNVIHNENNLVVIRDLEYLLSQKNLEHNEYMKKIEILNENLLENDLKQKEIELLKSELSLIKNEHINLNEKFIEEKKLNEELQIQYQNKDLLVEELYSELEIKKTKLKEMQLINEDLLAIRDENSRLNLIIQEEKMLYNELNILHNEKCIILEKLQNDINIAKSVEENKDILIDQLNSKLKVNIEFQSNIENDRTIRNKQFVDLNLKLESTTEEINNYYEFRTSVLENLNKILSQINKECDFGSIINNASNFDKNEFQGIFIDIQKSINDLIILKKDLQTKLDIVELNDQVQINQLKEIEIAQNNLESKNKEIEELTNLLTIECLKSKDLIRKLDLMTKDNINLAENNKMLIYENNVLKNKELTLYELEQKLFENNLETNSLKNSLDISSNKIKTFSDFIERIYFSISEFQCDIQQFQIQLNDLNDQLNTKSKHIHEVTDQLNFKSGSLDILEGQLTANETKLYQLNEIVNKKEVEVLFLNKKLEDFLNMKHNMELVTADNECERLKIIQELSNKINEIKHKEDEIFIYTSKINQMTSANHVLINTITEKDELISNLRTEIHKLDEKFSNLLNVNDINAFCTESETDSFNMNNQASDLVVFINCIKNKISSLGNYIYLIKDDNQKYFENNSELNIKINDLINRLSDANVQIDNLILDNNKFEAENKILINELSNKDIQLKENMKIDDFGLSFDSCVAKMNSANNELKKQVIKLEEDIHIANNIIKHKEIQLNSTNLSSEQFIENKYPVNDAKFGQDHISVTLNQDVNLFNDANNLLKDNEDTILYYDNYSKDEYLPYNQYNISEKLHNRIQLENDLPRFVSKLEDLFIQDSILIKIRNNNSITCHKEDYLQYFSNLFTACSSYIRTLENRPKEMPLSNDLFDQTNISKVNNKIIIDQKDTGGYNSRQTHQFNLMTFNHNLEYNHTDHINLLETLEMKNMEIILLKEKLEDLILQLKLKNDHNLLISNINIPEQNSIQNIVSENFTNKANDEYENSNQAHIEKSSDADILVHYSNEMQPKMISDKLEKKLDNQAITSEDLKKLKLQYAKQVKLKKQIQKELDDVKKSFEVLKNNNAIFNSKITYQEIENLNATNLSTIKEAYELQLLDLNKQIMNIKSELMETNLINEEVLFILKNFITMLRLDNFDKDIIAFISFNHKESKDYISPLKLALSSIESNILNEQEKSIKLCNWLINKLDTMEKDFDTTNEDNDIQKLFSDIDQEIQIKIKKSLDFIKNSFLAFIDMRKAFFNVLSEKADLHLKYETLFTNSYKLLVDFEEFVCLTNYKRNTCHSSTQCEIFQPNNSTTNKHIFEDYIVEQINLITSKDFIVRYKFSDDIISNLEISNVDVQIPILSLEDLKDKYDAIILDYERVVLENERLSKHLILLRENFNHGQNEDLSNNCSELLSPQLLSPGIESISGSESWLKSSSDDGLLDELKVLPSTLEMDDSFEYCDATVPPLNKDSLVPFTSRRTTHLQRRKLNRSNIRKSVADIAYDTGPLLTSSDYENSGKLSPFIESHSSMCSFIRDYNVLNKSPDLNSIDNPLAQLRLEHSKFRSKARSEYMRMKQRLIEALKEVNQLRSKTLSSGGNFCILETENQFLRSKMLELEATIETLSNGYSNCNSANKQEFEANHQLEMNCQNCSILSDEIQLLNQKLVHTSGEIIENCTDAIEEIRIPQREWFSFRFFVHLLIIALAVLITCSYDSFPSLQYSK